MRKRFARDAAGLPEPRPRRDAVFALDVEELAAFVRDNGRAPRANADDPSEAKLGVWLEKQRAAHRSGKLSADRAAAVDGVLGQDWSSTM